MSALKKTAAQQSKRRQTHHQMPTFDCWAAVFFDVCPEEDCSPAVEMSAFDYEFVKLIRGW